MSSPNSKVAAARIPSITELRKELDYGDPHSNRCTGFYDDIRTYRRKYLTSSGLLGSEVYDWKSPKDQSALDEITDAYLDIDGNGQVYWPDDDASPYRNKLQYTKHRSTIRRLVKQLIFRLNQQQYRNNKYKKKEQSSTSSVSHRGSSADNPIEVDEANLDPKVPSSLPAHSQTFLKPSLPIFKFGSDFSQPLQSPTSVNAAETNNAAATSAAAPSTQKNIVESTDIYDVPTSPEPSSPTKKRTITILHTGSGKNGSAKRLKTQRPQAGLARETRKPNPELPSTLGKWTSPREKRTIQRKDRAPTVDVDAAIISGDPTYRSTIESDIERSKRTEDLSTNNVLADADSHDGLVPNVPVGITKADSLAHQTKGRDTAGTTTTPQSHSSNAPSTSASSEHAKDLSTPAPIPDIPETGQSASENREKPQPLRSKPKIEVTYLLVLSRSPIYECKGWQPEGSFQEKSLAQLLQQLPFSSNIKGLDFTLEGPGVRMEQRIDCENESGFETMKRRFNKMIRVSLANHSDTNKALVFEIEIEPLKEEGLASADEDDTTSFL